MMSLQTIKNQRENERQWRARQKAAGMCTRCGQQPGVRKDYKIQSTCAECKDARKDRAKLRIKNPKLFFRALRQSVIEHLGAKCVCCQEAEPLFLHLEHSNNDGKTERSDAAMKRMMKGVLAGTRPDIRLMCSNCNCGRQLNGGVCPHISRSV